MNSNIKYFSAFILGVCLLAAVTASYAQGPGLFKRTILKTDSFEFGVGGTVAVTGAPVGSMRIEGWAQNRIELEAAIEITARSEAELDELAKVTGFVLHETLGRAEVTSVGTHDKAFMKKAAKKFPKELLGLPFRIDYTLKVPRYSDLQIDGGKGDLHISRIDGTVKINYLESNARLDLAGGGIFATIGAGSVDLSIPARSWRGRFADVQLAAGDMNISLPPGLNAEIDASILRSGSIENLYGEMSPRTRKEVFTEKLIAAKAGVGGVPLKFIVGDGRMRIGPLSKLD
jgi:hypothetical protein